jgi:NADPH-dependent curcumin reductase
MTIQNTQIIFAKDPGSGYPTDETFNLQISPISLDLQDGQVLVKNLYLSVDPYMRGRMNTKAKSYTDPFVLGQPLSGGGICQVVESKRDGLKKGDVVSGFIGWETFTKINKGQSLLRIENPLNVPLEYFLGVLGMPGATAYHGLLDIGEPKEGETVFVSAAAGAVGLIVGQIAKIKGCRVVGSAGSDEKVDLLVKEFGYDAAFNYKTQDQSKTLRELCPKGIDVYFDNVGGETLDTVIAQMNVFGRLVECGMISQYNAKEAYGVKNLMNIVGKQLKMQGFIISSRMGDRDFMKRFMSDVSNWIKDGKLKYAVNLVEGIENAPSAFIGMLKGANTGKQVVKIASKM